MTILPLVSLACVSATVALVVIAKLANPEQSALSMGMSGLARGRYPWIMRAAFVVRGAGALALVGAVSTLVPAAAQSELGLVFIALWGGGSLLLAAYDTDMPGEEPTPHGRAHVLIALVAYVAAGVGTVLVSLRLGDAEATADLARWALPIALVTAVAMVVQFVGFGAAARDAAAEPGSRPALRGLGRYPGLLQRVFVLLVLLWTVVVAAGV